MNEELKIDPEFERVIPPLTDDEFRQLEENILSVGEVLSELIVWNGTIVDGHNRYKIVQKHPDILYRIHETVFTDRFEAMDWICKNQLGRRNLTEAQKTMLLGNRYISERDNHGGLRGNQYSVLPSYQSDNLAKEQVRTAEKIAKEFGVGQATVIRAGNFVKGLDIADEYEPGISKKIAVGILKPSRSDVIAIANAPPEERSVLVERIKQPKAKPLSKTPTANKGTSKKSESHEPEIKQLLEISEDMVRPHPSVGECDILESMRGAVHMMMDTCTNYFTRYPKLLSEEQYKVKVMSVMQELKNYIDEIEGAKST